MSHFFGSKSHVYVGTSRSMNPDPDPKRFTITYWEQIGRALLVTVRYHGCTNFEGMKVLVYENMSIAKLSNMTSLDPHFTNGNDSPIARFKPTPYGLETARWYARMLT